MSGRTALECFFRPLSVALIGATDRQGSVGRTVLANLRNGTFRGKVFAVNPRHSSLLGSPCYASIGDVPDKVDLGVIVTPAATVPGIVAECVGAEVRSAIVLSAGFKELGPQGAELERQVQAELQRGEMRLVGPNCLGMMNPSLGLNATFAKDIARRGSVAFLSQSGALLTAILDWSTEAEVGFSGIISTGSMLDVSWGDLISFFGEDAETQSILLYMESIGDARSFLSAAREVALSKPIIVIKAGRSQSAAHAASSHTGALTGSDEVFDAAFRRCGVLRVQRISDLFHMAEVLGKQPRPQGKRLTILTNAGGPGVLATDALVATGGELAPLSGVALGKFNRLLPPHWSHGNPIDILGDADPDRYARAVEVAIENEHSDGLLIILAPQGMTDPAHVAERLKSYSKSSGKPVLASWMGGSEVQEGRAILKNVGIPSFDFPDTAAQAFNYMWKYSYNLRGLYETPLAADRPEGEEPIAQKAHAVLDEVIAAGSSGRTLLTELESKQLLELYGIPAVPTRLAKTAEEASELAQSLGFPVVLKVHSEVVTHKSDVGGVLLNLENAAAVRQAFQSIAQSVIAKAGKAAFLGVTVQPMIRRPDAYELILGCTIDAQFGPVILFGSGGQMVEVYRDRALALPPLNTTLAERLLEQTRIFQALKGIRGRAAVDISALQQILVRFSQMVVEQRRIKEVDINPLLASPAGLLALDARVVLYGREIPDAELPRSAIRPYPSRYLSRRKAKDGTEILIRPIRPEDEPLIVKFHETLSDQSVYLRYFHMESLSERVAHERLIRKCFIDYDREMALVAVLPASPGATEEIIGVGRLTKSRTGNDGEVAMLVSDAHQRQGLGAELLRRLIQVARDEKRREIVAHILPENPAMLALARRFDFRISAGKHAEMIVAALSLSTSATAALGESSSANR